VLKSDLALLDDDRMDPLTDPHAKPAGVARLRGLFGLRSPHFDDLALTVASAPDPVALEFLKATLAQATSDGSLVDRGPPTSLRRLRQQGGLSSAGLNNQ
jgi:hypothetical protein